MRTANINVRVKPETSRGWTWAINKYNFENCEKFTKTDVIELLIEGIVADSDLLKICLFLKQGLNLEEAAATAKGHNYKPIQLKAEANAEYGKIREAVKKAYKEGKTPANTSTINQDSSSTWLPRRWV